MVGVELLRAQIDGRGLLQAARQALGLCLCHQLGKDPVALVEVGRAQLPVVGRLAHAGLQPRDAFFVPTGEHEGLAVQDGRVGGGAARQHDQQARGGQSARNEAGFQLAFPNCRCCVCLSGR